MTDQFPGSLTTRILDVALIMTVLNEEGSLPKFLSGLAEQSNLPAEIIITDGGSVDRSVEILESWGVPEGVHLTMIPAKGANISTGRNLAIKQTSRERIVVTDAGTVLDPEWLYSLNLGFDAGADVVSGFFRPTGRTLFERTLARVVTPLLDEIKPEDFLPSSRSVGFTKRAWDNAGGYPEWLDYCEDLVFDLALKATGARFTFAPGALVAWSARPDLMSFGEQYYRYARGDGKAGIFAKRHLARYLAYLAGAFLLIGSLSQRWLLGPLVLGFVGYQLRFFRRIWRDRREFGGRAPVALLLTPMMVLFGDLSKMLGYPAGLMWKYRRRAGAMKSVRKAEDPTC